MRLLEASIQHDASRHRELEMLGLKALGAVGTAAKTAGFAKKMYNKFKGVPTEETDKVPFLDLLNIDPEYSKILDDRLEEKFLEDWIKDIENKTGQMNVGDLDVNTRMQNWLKTNFDNRFIKGHTAPSGNMTKGQAKEKTKSVKKKSFLGGLGKQV